MENVESIEIVLKRSNGTIDDVGLIKMIEDYGDRRVREAIDKARGTLIAEHDICEHEKLFETVYEEQQETVRVRGLGMEFKDTRLFHLLNLFPDYMDIAKRTFEKG
jgi:hypothetical protein